MVHTIPQILVCNYGGAGNMMGAPVYEQGAPTTKCCPSMSQSSRWTNLCGASSSP